MTMPTPTPSYAKVNTERETYKKLHQAFATYKNLDKNQPKARV